MNMKKSQVSTVIAAAVLIGWLFNIFPGRFLAAKLSTWPLLNRWKILSPQAPIVITNRETVRVTDNGDLQEAAGTIKPKMSLLVEAKTAGVNILASAVNLTSDGSFVTSAESFGADNESYFVVLSDGRQAPVTQSLLDPATGLIFFKADLDGVPAASFGNSKDLVAGEKIIFTRNSLQNFSNQIQSGLVGFGQAQVQGKTLESDYPRRGFGVSFLPTTLLGGEAVVNSTGDIMGIWNGQDIISSDVLKQAMALYFNNQSKVVRPQFGFSYRLITPNESRLAGIVEGAQIKDTLANSPARQAGLTTGDIIVQVDGQQVRQDSPLEEILQKYKPGDEVRLAIVRGKQNLSLILKADQLK
jgi:S1-C subfamily serine protease